MKLNKNLRHSIIISCIIKDNYNKVIINHKNLISYHKILLDLYEIFDIDLDLKLNLNKKNSKIIMKEIIKIIKRYDYKIDIHIRLKFGEFINYKN
jgi:hypothetical protein